MGTRSAIHFLEQRGTFNIVDAVFIPMCGPYYVTGDNELVSRRANWSDLKMKVLQALVRLDDTGEPAIFNNDLSIGYYCIVDVAREIYGETAFTNGKLDINRRSGLNKVLNTLHSDGFVGKAGKHYHGIGNSDPRVSNRDFSRCHWCANALGKNASTMGKLALSRWFEANRFYSFHGIKVNRKLVKRTDEMPWG